jgi:hypothetical protein
VYATPVVLIRAGFLVLGDRFVMLSLGLLTGGIAAITHRCILASLGLIVLRGVLLLVGAVFVPSGVVLAVGNDDLGLAW